MNSREADVESYKRAIVELVRQREQLKAQLAEERRRHAEETNVLRAQRDVGISPEIEVRDTRIRELTSIISTRDASLRLLRGLAGGPPAGRSSTTDARGQAHHALAPQHSAQRPEVTPQTQDSAGVWIPPTREEWEKVTKKLILTTRESVNRKKRLRETLLRLAEAEDTVRQIEAEAIDRSDEKAHRQRLQEALAMVELRRAELDGFAQMMVTSPQSAQHRGRGRGYRQVPVIRGKRV